MEVKLPIYPGNKANIVGNIEVKVGDEVTEGNLLTNIETGKGSRDLKAKTSGIIKSIHIAAGDEVHAGDLLFVIEDASVDTKQEQIIVNKTEVPVSELDITSDLDTDLAIIGGGPGGYVTAIYAAKKGLDVTLIEEADLGGTCLNFGCIPTKALIKVAHTYKNIKEADSLGINVAGEVSFDFEKVIEYKDGIVSSLVDGIGYLLEKNNIKLVREHASFIDNYKIKVADHTISAKNIIIATGSKLTKLEVPGANLSKVQTAKEALIDPDYPDAITIIGGGVIGLEFAFMYREFGAEVNILTHRDQILRGTDRDAVKFIEEKANSLGINIYYNSPINDIREATNGKLITNFSHAGIDKAVVSDKVLMTVGTPMNIDGLDLDKTDVALNENKTGIAVNDYMQTSVENIYAIGDVNKIYQLAHVASHQGIIAVDHILDNEKAFDILTVPKVIYTHPEIASVGYTEDELSASHIDYESQTMDFAAIGKALIDNNGEGFIKVHMDKASHKILGALIVGPDANNLISDFALAITKGLTIDDIADTIYAHPTTSEINHEIAMKLLDLSIHE